MIRRVVISALASTALIALLLTVPAFAGEGKGRGADDKFGFGYRPGLGIGDKNHEHLGPPGQEEPGNRGNGKGHEENDAD